MRLGISLLLSLGFVGWVVQPAPAANIEWVFDNAMGDFLFSTSGNWYNDADRIAGLDPSLWQRGVPGLEDSAIFKVSGCIIDSTMNIGVAKFKGPAYNAGESGTLFITGGTVRMFASVNLPPEWRLGNSGGGGLVEMSGGAINIDTNLLIPRTASSTAVDTFNLHGGSVTVRGALRIFPGHGLLDLANDGTLYVDPAGTNMIAVQDLITNGLITANQPGFHPEASMTNIGGKDYIKVMAMPEPATLSLLLLGGLLGMRRRR